MLQRKTFLLLILLFLLTLSFRLYFAFSYENFPLQSYFHIYQTEKIKQNPLLTNYDDLSYSGRILNYPPLFHYLLALTSFIPNNFKIIPALLFSLSVIIAFFIALRISNSEGTSLFSALLYAFTPIAIKETLNAVSVYTLAIPLIFLIIYLIIKLKEKPLFNYLILTTVFLFFTHPIFIFLTISFMLYPILLQIVNIKINENRKEAITFFIILSLLVSILIFKSNLLELGFDTIFQNIPDQIKQNFFRAINPFEIVLNIGLITLIFGLTGISYGLFKLKKASIFLISSLILSTFLLLAFKLIEFNLGILILGLSLAILSSLGIKTFFSYISKTKLHNFKSLFLILIIILVILTSIIPSITQALSLDVVSDKEIEAIKFLETKTSKLSTIASSPIEGHLINFAKRRNIADTYYLGAKDTTERFEDLKTLYKTEFSSVAKQIISKYGIDYILLSKHGKKFYEIKKLSFTDKCIKEVFKNEEAGIYSAEC